MTFNRPEFRQAIVAETEMERAVGCCSEKRGDPDKVGGMTPKKYRRALTIRTERQIHFGM